MLPVAVILLLYTIAQGTTIDGANASRWIRIPFIGLSFQSSTLASLTLLTYMANFLSKGKIQGLSFGKSFVQLWLPILTVVLLIFPSNLSTAALLFFMCCTLIYVSGYPLKYLFGIIGTAWCWPIVYFICEAFPDAVPNRVDTWVSRIENFPKLMHPMGIIKLNAQKLL